MVRVAPGHVLLERSGRNRVAAPRHLEGGEAIGVLVDIMDGRAAEIKRFWSLLVPVVTDTVFELYMGPSLSESVSSGGGPLELLS